MSDFNFWLVISLEYPSAIWLPRARVITLRTYPIITSKDEIGNGPIQVGYGVECCPSFQLHKTSFRLAYHACNKIFYFKIFSQSFKKFPPYHALFSGTVFFCIIAQSPGAEIYIWTWVGGIEREFLRRAGRRLAHPGGIPTRSTLRVVYSFCLLWLWLPIAASPTRCPSGVMHGSWPFIAPPPPTYTFKGGGGRVHPEEDLRLCQPVSPPSTFLYFPLVFPGCFTWTPLKYRPRGMLTASRFWDRKQLLVTGSEMFTFLRRKKCLGSWDKVWRRPGGRQGLGGAVTYILYVVLPKCALQLFCGGCYEDC